ncbi:MAG: tyrosine-type recombinase/integrase [Pseudodesulfovibrio sp.]|uniref:tyrosine-type recombinase/integrase n=1 Tax=Pseudodesulfovibrio sp. TaxID=2035812 RepID=UPI003D116C99
MAIKRQKGKKETLYHVYYRHPYLDKTVYEPFGHDEDAAKKRNAEVKYLLKYDRESFLQERQVDDMDKSGPTVDDILLMYLQDVATRKKGQDLAKENMATTMSHLKFVRPIIGHIPVSELTKAHLREVVAELRKPHVIDMTYTPNGKTKKVKRKVKGNSQTTINRKVSIIQSALNWAEEQELIEENPVFRFSGAKRGPNNKPAPPTVEEANLIVAAASDHVRRAVVLGVGTGARMGRSELLKATWADVSFERNCIRISSAEKNKNITYRDIQLKPNVMDALRYWRKKDADIGHVGHIIHWNEKPIKSLKTAWWRTLERAGITRRIRPYDCRHHFVTEALRKGCDLKAISTIAGHADPTMILKHYQEVVEETKAAVINSTSELELPDLDTGPQDLAKAK